MPGFLTCHVQSSTHFPRSISSLPARCSVPVSQACHALSTWLRDCSLFPLLCTWNVNVCSNPASSWPSPCSQPSSLLFILWVLTELSVPLGSGGLLLWLGGPSLILTKYLTCLSPRTCHLSWGWCVSLFVFLFSLTRSSLREWMPTLVFQLLQNNCSFCLTTPLPDAQKGKGNHLIK